MVHYADIEGIARDLHGITGAEPPIDAFALAHALGFATRPWFRDYGRISGREIRYPARLRHTGQHRIVAHEIGHPLLLRGGEDDRDEVAADRLALAIMLPHTPFVRDLHRHDWSLFALLEIHANVSARGIAERMAHVSPAWTEVYDQGHRTHAYGNGEENHFELADAALGREAVVSDGLATAYPLLDGRNRRVVVVRRAA
jgi:hypothetical protein